MNAPAEPAAQKTSPWRIVVRSLVSLGAIASTVLLAAALRRPDAVRRPSRAGASESVEVAPALAHSGEFDFEVDGMVVPYREVVMAAEVAGRIEYKSLDCQEGRAVGAGDLLFRIDAREYELELEQAQGSLDELAAQMNSAKLLSGLAEEDHKISLRELSRFEQAVDRSVFSRSEIDTAKRNELAARNALQSRRDEMLLLSARRRRVQGALDMTTLNTSRCEVRAPISGVIVREEVEQDGFVQKGGLLLSIRDTSKMEVRCSLRMRQLQWLWQAADIPASDIPAADIPASDGVSGASQEPSPAGPVSRLARAYEFPVTRATIIYVLNGTPFAWQGRLVRYADSGIDQETRLMPSIVQVDAPHQVVRLDDATRSPDAPPTLLSGMYVKVRIHTKLAVPLLRVPVEAVGPGGQLWVVHEGRLKRVWASVIHANQERVLVEQDAQLPAGSHVVTSPLASPIEGATVKIVDLQPEGGSKS